MTDITVALRACDCGIHCKAGCIQEKAADEIERLWTAQRPLIEFARWAIQEGSWEGGALEGDYVQDKAEELGLIIKTTYNPLIHGESDIAEVGDDWYVFGPLLTANDATSKG